MNRALSWDQSLDRFLAHLAVERGLSMETVEAYSHDLGSFAAFARRSGVDDPGKTGPHHVLLWLKGLKQEGLSPGPRTGGFRR